MATVLTPADQAILLTGISWETYERLLAEHDGRASPRFTYDRGELEIMVLSLEHEELSRPIDALLTVVSEELEIDFVNPGSTTFKREDLSRGFEADTCLYIHQRSRIRGKKRVELPADPSPDLAIEIDITRSSLDKMGIYATMGVPEVWRYDGETLRMFYLEAGTYEERTDSPALSGLTADDMSHLLAEGRTTPRPQWLRRVREWARSQATGRR